MHNLYLLESDHENVGGLLIKYGDGYAQTLTCLLYTSDAADE